MYITLQGQCKTFDSGADGYVRGEGAGVILLKPLAKAIEDQDQIYGVIRGSAVNHGGKARTLTSPNIYAQSQVICAAYRKESQYSRQYNFLHRSPREKTARVWKSGYYDAQ